jgi:hypothetical protein
MVEGNSGKIEDLIRVTEERALAEERVRMLLSGIAQGQGVARTEMTNLSKQVTTLSLCVNGLQQMISTVFEYMAVIAGRDQDEIRLIRERLLEGVTDKSGITFGEGVRVGVTGDMIGGDQKEGG